MTLFQSIFGNLNVILKYLKSDIIKKQRAFKIGLVSIYLVVFFLTMLYNVISLSPNIFIRLAEEQVSEADFIFLPQFGINDLKDQKDIFDKAKEKKNSSDLNQNITNLNISFSLLNFDEIQEKLKNIKFLKGVLPRWLIMGNSSNLIKKTWAQSNMIILNSELENKIGMGRKLHLPRLNLNECYVSNSLYKSLKSENQDNVLIDVKLSGLIKALQPSQIYNKFENQDFFNPNENYYEDENNDIDDENDNKNNNNYNIDNAFFYANLTKIEREAFLIRKFLNKYLNDKKTFVIPRKIILDNIKKHLNVFNISSNFTNEKEIINKLMDFSISRTLLFFLIPKDNEIVVQILNEIIKEDNDENPIKFLFNQFFYYNKTNDNLSFSENIKNILKETSNEEDIEIELPNLNNFIEKFTDEDLLDLLSFQLNLTIKTKVSSTEGKWPSASGNVIAIDSKYMNNYLEYNAIRIIKLISKKIDIPFIEDFLIEFTKNVLKDFNINKYALSINGIINNKFDLYKLNQNDMRVKISDLSVDITNSLGIDYKIQVTLPIFTMMKTIEIAKVFLQNIFYGIMFFLWLLSVILIYSLMLGNVDERTYEFGMLRSLGFRKKHLISMILIQGIIFAIPGIVLGLVSSYICNIYIGFLLNWYSGLVIPYNMSLGNIIFGTVLGLSIPLVSSYFPIKKCLDSNLKETLTIFNKKIGNLLVNMIKLENLGISLSAFISSLILIIMGFITYYLAPLSFLLMNPSIFILIMMFILIIMLIGMIVLIQIIIPFLERNILKIIFLIFYKDRNIHFVVLKNLEGHSRRNKKLSIMFMIALGFIIFSGCTLNLIVSFIQTLAESSMGGDAFLWYLNGETDSINQILFEEYLNKTMKNFPDLIENYTFRSFPLSDIIGKSTRSSALNGFPRFPREIIGLDKNFLTSGYVDLYSYTEYNKNLNYTILPKINKVDLTSLLFLNPNIEEILPIEKDEKNSINYPINPYFSENLIHHEFSIIAAEGLRDTMALSIDNPASINFKYNYYQIYPCKIIGMANKLPGSLTYSSYSTLSLLSPFYTSIEQIKKLVDLLMEKNEDLQKKINESIAYSHTPDHIRKQGLTIKYKEKANNKLKEMVFFEMKNLLGDDLVITSFIDEIIETSNKIKKIMEYVFIVLGLIALILSFFLIWTSFYANIRENICEYGIMRSIGINEKQSTRMYIYEAASIIIASILTGTFIGIVISCTLILQFDMFVELPFIFNFPYKLYFILTSFRLVMGLLGSYYPIYEVNHMSLIKIMKGLSE